jgi:hypothetical protein
MGRHYKRTLAGLLLPLAVAAGVLPVVLDGGAAGAHTTRQVKTEPLLSIGRGAFEISLGPAPVWLPLSGKRETLTLIAGAPASARTSADNAYVGFTSAGRSCAATPAASGRTFYTLAELYSAAHAASSHAGVFAPNGGAARGTYIDSVAGVVIRQSASTRACIWLAATSGRVTPAAKGKHKQRKKAQRSLAETLVLPLLNNTFAASVSNLTGASAGSGGISMYALDGGHAFRYAATTTQCGKTSADPVASVPAATPGSESVSLSASPCSTDATTFNFSATGLGKAIVYPLSDALADPPTTVGAGGCELDPLTGASMAAAQAYLSAVGCKLGTVQITPYEKTLTRGSVSWASVDGAVAELAPAKSTVDLVLNGTP